MLNSRSTAAGRLHGYQRMVKLGREITRLIIENDGPEAFLQRIADSYWLQSLGCVLGFDWHSSGVITRYVARSWPPHHNSPIRTSVKYV